MSAPDDSAAAPGPDALRAAGVAHDVNQMLAVIRGRAELLLRQPGAAHAPLQAIVLAANDASAMLERLRAGPAPVAPAVGTVGVARAVAEAAAFALPPDGAWAGSAAVGRWALLDRVPPGAVAAVAAPVLREVLTNLLLNALRALPRGGVVTVDLAAAADPTRLRLRVADDGPGLPPGDPEQVFRAGFTTSGTAGRGVGLAACRQLLAACGGSLTAVARGGPGAVFTLDLPAGAAGGMPSAASAVPPSTDAPTVAATAPTVATAGDASAALRGLGVLVVDDEAAMRDMLAEVLAELGCAARCCRDGAAALAAVAAGEVAGTAVALVDQRLPGLPGDEVLTRLRAALPALATVAMTGWEGHDARPAAADFSLRKPLGVDELADVLARAAALHRERRQAGTGGGMDA